MADWDNEVGGGGATATDSNDPFKRAADTNNNMFGGVTKNNFFSHSKMNIFF